MAKRTLIVVTLVILLAGCSDNPVIEQTSEEIIIANAYTLQRAVEAYKSEHGRYPDDAGPCLNYADVLDYLPGGRRLLNPYTLQRSVPNAHAAITPGDVGYRNYEWTDGYVINGMGMDGEVISILHNYPWPDSILEMESATIENCRWVVEAAEAYAAANDGGYSRDVDSLKPYLPGGALLINARWGVATEPVDDAATSAMQIGYAEQISVDGVTDGYFITAFGYTQMIVTTGFRTTCPTWPCVYNW